MQSQQPIRLKQGATWLWRLDRCSKALKRHENPLPSLLGSERVGRDQRKARASGQSLSELHSLADTERPCRWRDLTDRLLAVDLRGKRYWLTEQRLIAACCDLQFKAGNSDCDNHA
jgi:hypothetical protein